jgi:hypothetical protein
MQSGSVRQSVLHWAIPVPSVKQPNPLQSFGAVGGHFPAPSHTPPLSVMTPMSTWQPGDLHCLPDGAQAQAPAPSHFPPHPISPVQSLCASVPAAANVQVPVAFLQLMHRFPGPEQELSQQTPSTQKFEPQSLSFVQVAPFGFLPLVHWRSAVQKLGASHLVVAFESVPPAMTPVHFPLPDAAHV